MLPRPETRPVFTVSALAREARVLVEERFQLVWVEGEVSNLRRPASGHWYFTLKDERAQLRCCMFANRNRAVRIAIRDGVRVLVRGRLTLYEARGDFQLVAEHMEPAGEGALRAAFEALKQRLEAEGLFDPARKRPLPALPRRLAVISSASGAALRDVLHVIERRYPVLEVVLLPVAVQGERAEGDVLRALAKVPKLAPDVVLITRGGGSLEDLWTFNSERIARAIAACPVPTVSAVGHQTDFTIADFVADVRAPTPSAGAELITPDRADLDARIALLHRRMRRALTLDLTRHAQHVRHLRARLINPRTRLQQQMQRTDELAERLHRAMRRTLQRDRIRLDAARCHLLRLHPKQAIERHRRHVAELTTDLRNCARQILANKRNHLALAARTLEAVSPLATLARGYTVLTTTTDGTRTPVTSIRQTHPGANLTAHLQDGALEVRVENIDDDNQLPKL